MPVIDLEYDLQDQKTEFEPLPTDQYAARIIDVTLTKSKASNRDMLKIVWEITDGEYIGRRLWDNLPLHVGWRVKQYAELIGIESGSQLNTDDFLGTEAILSVGIEEPNPQNGLVNATNRINKILPTG